MPRIVSFLPAATEITCALGAGNDLVARSHECDYPPAVKHLPVISGPALAIDTMSQAEIDSAVSSQLAAGESLYRVDEVLLRELAPDVVLTQDLCQGCAPSGTELTRVLRELPSKPDVLRKARHVLRSVGLAERASIVQISSAPARPPRLPP